MTGPLNYTTKIQAKQTAGECIDLLARCGAEAVAVSYADANPVGLMFRLRTAAGRTEDFSMPVNVDGVRAMLLKAREARELGSRSTDAYTTREHAARVAWRITKDWLEAQLAIIAARMVTLDEVMLPYMQIRGGTVYEVYSRKGLALTASESS